MRSDFKFKFTEVHKSRYKDRHYIRRWKNKNINLKNIADIDDHDFGLTHHGMSRNNSGNIAGYSLIIKFLKSKLGLVWNDVYSEITASVDRRTTGGISLYTDLRHSIDIFCGISSNGDLLNKYGDLIRVGRLYVDPIDGIIKKCDILPRYNSRITPLQSEREIDVISTPDGVYERRGNSWIMDKFEEYEVVYVMSQAIVDDKIVNIYSLPYKRTRKTTYCLNGKEISALKEKYWHLGSNKAWVKRCSWHRKNKINYKPIKEYL
jgi:hypothetical protein